MKQKYHVSDDGNAHRCSAQEDNCPFNSSHFESIEETRKFYEKTIDQNLNIPSIINCDTFANENYDQESKTFVDSLDKDSKDFLQEYVNNKYLEINASLWNNERIFSNTMLNKKLSMNNGDLKSLWRVPSQEKLSSLLNNKKIGDIIHLKGYTSTSENPRSIMPMMISHADNYMKNVDEDEWEDDGLFNIKVPDEWKKKDPNVVFQFITSQGGKVSSLSKLPQEKETLLPSNSHWKIVSIKKILSSSLILTYLAIRANIFHIQQKFIN